MLFSTFFAFHVVFPFIIMLFPATLLFTFKILYLDLLAGNHESKYQMAGSTGFEPAFSAPITINDLEDRFGYDPI